MASWLGLGAFTASAPGLIPGLGTEGFPGGSAGKNLPARPGFDPWIGKIPLKKGKATHSSILAWRIPWTV